MEAALWFLRGENVNLVARDVGVTAATLASWHEPFLNCGVTALKSRKGDPVFKGNSRLKSKVGELTMEIELLNEKIDRLEAGCHPTQRRQRE